MKVKEYLQERLISNDVIYDSQDRMVGTLEDILVEFAGEQIKLLNLADVSFAKRKVCSMGIDYEKCSEHPLNELGCSSCEKYIEQT